MTTVTVYDATGANLPKLTVPAGVKLAGYVTGSAGVPWSAKQLQANPDAVRIDQSPTDTPADETADVIDMETGAATLGDLITWVKAAQASYTANKRPGQRRPAIYAAQRNLAAVTNTLTAGGITSGVPLWVCDLMPAHNAIELIDTAAGPFPVIGVQYQFESTYDISVFSAAWLEDTSDKPPVSTPEPGTQGGWRHCSKCGGLFFGPGQASSRCPVGAQHDGSQSHDYTLGFSK